MPAALLNSSIASLPLLARGSRAEHVLAFARKQGEQEVIAIAARCFVGLGAARMQQLALTTELWADTALPLGTQFGTARYRDIFTGREFTAHDGASGKELAVAHLLTPLPVALLERV